MSEFQNLNIYEKMARISAECVVIRKMQASDLEVGQYRAVSSGDVLKAVAPLEAKYGIYSFPLDRQRQTSYMEREVEMPEGAPPRKASFMVDEVATTYRFVNTDNPEEHLDMVSYGTGIDNGEMGIGKAMTYAEKYALLKAYKIRIEDIPAEGAQAPSDSIPNSGMQDEDLPFYDGSSSAGAMVSISSADQSAARTQTVPRQQNPKPEPQTATAGAGMSKNAPRAMTAAEARAMVLPFGQQKGKTLGEVLAVNPGMISWFANDEKYAQGVSNRKYPEIRIAAQLLAGEAQNRSQRAS